MTNALRSDTARASSSTAEPVAFSKLLSLLRWIDDDYADEATFRLLRRELGAAQRPALFGTVVLQSDTAPVAVICVTWSRWYVHASRWRLIRGPRPTSEKGRVCGQTVRQVVYKQPYPLGLSRFALRQQPERPMHMELASRHPRQ